MEARYQWGLSRLDGEGWDKCASRHDAEAKQTEDIDVQMYDEVICLRRVPVSELIGKYMASLLPDEVGLCECAGDGDFEFFGNPECDPWADGAAEEQFAEVANAGVKAMMAQADAMGLWSDCYVLVPREQWPVE